MKNAVPIFVAVLCLAMAFMAGAVTCLLLLMAALSQ
jgi:hypothetical protein